MGAKKHQNGEVLKKGLWGVRSLSKRGLIKGVTLGKKVISRKRQKSKSKIKRGIWKSVNVKAHPPIYISSGEEARDADAKPEGDTESLL